MLNIYILSDQLEFNYSFVSYIENHSGMRLIGRSNNLSKVLLSLSGYDKPDILIVDQKLNENEFLNLTNLLKENYKLLVVCDLEMIDFMKVNMIDYVARIDNHLGVCKFLRDQFNPSGASVSPPKLYFEDYFFIKCSKGRFVRIVINEIICIEAKQNYISIVVVDGSYTTNFSIGAIENVLPQGSFVKVHRSFIVNSAKIHSIESNAIFLLNGQKIPIGHSYRKPLLNHFQYQFLEIKKVLPLICLICNQFIFGYFEVLFV